MSTPACTTSTFPLLKSFCKFTERGACKGGGQGSSGITRFYGGYCAQLITIWPLDTIIFSFFCLPSAHPFLFVASPAFTPLLPLLLCHLYLHSPFGLNVPAGDTSPRTSVFISRFWGSPAQPWGALFCPGPRSPNAICSIMEVLWDAIVTCFSLPIYNDFQWSDNSLQHINLHSSKTHHNILTLKDLDLGQNRWQREKKDSLCC